MKEGENDAREVLERGLTTSFAPLTGRFLDTLLEQQYALRDFYTHPSSPSGMQDCLGIAFCHPTGSGRGHLCGHKRENKKCCEQERELAQRKAFHSYPHPNGLW